jgi:hypothetical protein
MPWQANSQFSPPLPNEPPSSPEYRLYSPYSKRTITYSTIQSQYLLLHFIYGVPKEPHVPFERWDPKGPPSTPALAICGDGTKLQSFAGSHIFFPRRGSFPRTPGGLGRPFLPGLLGGNIQNRCTGSARAMTGHSIAPLVCQSWRMRITLSIVLLLTLAGSAQAQRLRVLPPEEYDRPYTEGPIITIPARDQVHVRELCPNRSLTSA